jgi:hypothetical protein
MIYVGQTDSNKKKDFVSIYDNLKQIIRGQSAHCTDLIINIIYSPMDNTIDLIEAVQKVWLMNCHENLYIRLYQQQGKLIS